MRDAEDRDQLWAAESHCHYEDAGRAGRWSGENAGNLAIRQELTSALDDFLPQGSESGQVLDVGCGTGWWLAHLAQRGFPRSGLHGAEIDPRRAEAARVAVPGADIQVASARSLPWEDGRFATITFFLVLSSLRDGAAVEEALREANRLCAVGGRMIVWEPRVPTPANPRTRRIRRRDLERVLGRADASGSTTLFPPLARRLGRSTPTVYPLLVCLPLFRTHRIDVFIRRPD